MYNIVYVCICFGIFLLNGKFRKIGNSFINDIYIKRRYIISYLIKVAYGTPGEDIV